MQLDPRISFPVMCLTQDGLGMPHSTQVSRLCVAGAKWIQLRMKDASEAAWLAEARACVKTCHAHGAILVVNDSVDIAVKSGADGVHLGKLDAGWTEARRKLGPSFIIGGTVNNSGDAQMAVSSGCLDYAGVGPLRFTATKRALSPVIGIEGVGRLIRELRGLPAWVIGGVGPPDMPAIRAMGAAGAAVSSFLFRGDNIEHNYRELLESWRQPTVPLPQHASVT
jgi:thiamine-phosphate pyrophosphorylase